MNGKSSRKGAWSGDVIIYILMGINHISGTAEAYSRQILYAHRLYQVPA